MFVRYQLIAKNGRRGVMLILRISWVQIRILQIKIAEFENFFFSIWCLIMCEVVYNHLQKKILILRKRSEMLNSPPILRWWRCVKKSFLFDHYSLKSASHPIQHLSGKKFSVIFDFGEPCLARVHSPSSDSREFWLCWLLSRPFVEKIVFDFTFVFVL